MRLLSVSSDAKTVKGERKGYLTGILFYDYTKVPRPELRRRPNYHITFSRSETNWRLCELALSNGVNVAVVFDVKRGKPLPEQHEGYPVLDGDLSDLRFLDKRTSTHAVIIGLRAKGKARRDTSGFVVTRGD